MAEYVSIALLCTNEVGGMVKTFRSKMDGNVHSPDAYPQGWEEVTQ